MIVAKDLKIGNLVIDKFNWQIGEISGIYKSTVSVSLNSGYLECSYDSIDPITLTEEWLIRADFQSNFSQTAFWDKKVPIVISVEEGNFFYGKFVISDYDDPFVEKIKKLEYVHQFQNLYSILGDKEITFTYKNN